MSTAENVRAVQMMLGLAKTTRKPGLKAAAYKAAGLHLERLRHGRPKIEWVDLVETCCLISERRAYELMAIGKSIEALELQRAANAARVRKHKRKKSKGLLEKLASKGMLFVARPGKKMKADQ